MRPVTALLAAVGTLAAGAHPAAAAWTPPVPGDPVRLFALGPDPFARGQHRGVDLLAVPGEPVRAACPGRVVFAGRVAGEGTVSVRCGAFRVSYTPVLSRAVRAGERVGAGARLGRAAGPLHFGVRREGRRWGYVDPLRLLAGTRPPPPAPLVRAPRPRAPAHRPAARSRPAALAPWTVWLGVAFGLAGLAGAGTLRLPYRRRQEGAPCRASSTSSSSPTTPSSP